MNGSAICLEGVKMRMGGKVLLEVARFELPTASCTILSGRNGAGKTTLLKIAAGLLGPDEASVQTDHGSVPWRRARPSSTPCRRECLGCGPSGRAESWVP